MLKPLQSLRALHSAAREASVQVPTKAQTMTVTSFPAQSFWLKKVYPGGAAGQSARVAIGAGSGFDQTVSQMALE